MDNQKAIDELKKIFSGVGCKLTDEHAASMYFSYNKSLFCITEEFITGYADFHSKKEPIDGIANCECGLITPQYREQLVTQLEQVPRYYWMNETTFNETDENGIKVSLGPCSATFYYYFLPDKKFLTYILDRLSMPRRQHSMDFCIPPSLTTIKVENLNQKDILEAYNYSTVILNYCFFALSSVKKIQCSLSTEWPTTMRTRSRLKKFTFDAPSVGKSIPLKAIKIDSTILQFYLQAASTNILSLKYLAYYQVLEYFFLIVAEENLFNSLKRIINSPKFRARNKDCENIVDKVLSYRRESDETKMLKGVLAKYIDEEELILFITEYEKFLKEKIYTEKRGLFGEEFSRIELKPNHVFGPLATQIKTIRNALVHASDRYERNERYIPFSKKHDDLLTKEMPLIEFLAEKVIIASAQEYFI